MISIFPKPIVIISTAFVFMGCGATTLISTPIANIDVTPTKISDLTDTEKQNWGHLDLVTDTIPGMSLNKAYTEIIGAKKGAKITVAVLDSGIDLNHEDLDDVLWTNTGEKPGDGIDNDNNGYIDDIHGYNFLGDSYNEQLEVARIVKLKIGNEALQNKAKNEVETEYSSALQSKGQYEQFYQSVKNADEALTKEFKKTDYTQKEVYALAPSSEAMQQHIGVALQAFSYAEDLPAFMLLLEEGIVHFSDQVNYNYNVTFDGRKIVGDNPYDITDTKYGNGNPQNLSKDESHGTHVAGIIAAERNNGKGINGVANNVSIMSVRVVPNGDEYDKDIALGIRYAVDNGAKIINGSFGKSYSPNAEWVYEAIKYAAKKDVLFVHAAGNDGADLDDLNNPNFPNDQINNGPEIANNVITVGALNPKYGGELLADYSNYGKVNVDIFAPGTDIYSTYPNNTYEYSPGTSMAAPAVAGIAALVWSQYPNLKASEIKKVILESGLAPTTKVMVGGASGKTATLQEISTTGKIANAYNALIMAEAVTSGKIKI